MQIFKWLQKQPGICSIGAYKDYLASVPEEPETLRHRWKDDTIVGRLHTGDPHAALYAMAVDSGALARFNTHIADLGLGRNCLITSTGGIIADVIVAADGHGYCTNQTKSL